MISGGGTSDITGKACSPYVAHWNWDTYAMAHSTGASVLKAGGDKWFFITADYVFGATLQADTTAVVTKGGGSVVGSAKHPLGTTDFSSQLLQAASSGANVIGVANAGGDTINSIKQAHEFHVPQKLAALVAFVSDIHSIGLETAQGTLLTEAFYWDQDEQSRAFSKRFFARARQMPTSVQAGTYSAITHWLQAVKAVGSTDSDAVMAQMRKTPVEDFATHGAMLRADGRLMRDMYLFQVKTPAESKGEWDLYKVVSKVPAEQAFRPMSEGGCKLLQ
jgi:branched-chain amino acid transport system substrate-binding protein